MFVGSGVWALFVVRIQTRFFLISRSDSRLQNTTKTKSQTSAVRVMLVLLVIVSTTTKRDNKITHFSKTKYQHQVLIYI